MTSLGKKRATEVTPLPQIANQLNLYAKKSITRIMSNNISKKIINLGYVIVSSDTVRILSIYINKMQTTFIITNANPMIIIANA